MTVLKFKKEVPQIKIIEPFRPEVIEFENKDDFAVYLSDHEDLKELSTLKLNKMFKIPDFKITKSKGEFALKRIVDNQQSTQRRIEIIEQQLQLLTSTVQDVLNILSEKEIIKLKN